MSVWVLTFLKNSRSYSTLVTWATTNTRHHFFMAWSRYKPTKKLIWKTVRGKVILCGWRWVWDTPNIDEQLLPGDTHQHNWRFIHLAPDDHFWYYLFTRDGPYGQEIQGPLVHVPPFLPFYWTARMYVATNLKGIFYTNTFSGPGGAPPIWYTVNGGLFSLKIKQLCADPLGAEYGQYAIAGDPGDHILYRRWPSLSPAWIPILTNDQAEDLTGTTGGNFRWVTTTVNRPAYVYLLFTGTIATRHTWLFRSPDYGATWTVHSIYLGTYNYNAGNLSIGILSGSSPHPPGDVIYATLNCYIGGRSYIFFSSDNGDTWSAEDFTGVMQNVLRCLVDPTDQSIVYMGGFGAAHFPRQLFRSADHGTTMVNISDTEDQVIAITPYPGNLWIDPSLHQSLRVLQANHVWTTPDSGANWTDHGETEHPVTRHLELWENPTRLYLARDTSPPGYPFPDTPHVIFVSDNEGATMEGKGGPNTWHFEGMGDSIPYNCGGVSLQGILPLPPY